MSKILRSATIIPPSLYVERGADRQLEQIIDEMGRPGYVLVARQMGKTNLLVNMKRQQEKAGNIVVYFDLTNRIQSARAFFRQVIDGITEAGTPVFSEVRAQIEAQRRASADDPNVEYDRDLRLLLRAAPARKLIIVFDEVDSLIGLDYSDSVFAQIRSMYFYRASHAEYLRLTYILAGVAAPIELIQNRSMSPFNTGEEIALRDFTRDEFRKLVENAQLGLSDEVLGEVYAWTGGHPRMTWDVTSALEDIMLSGRTVVKQDVFEVIDTMYLAQFDHPPVDDIRALIEKNLELRGAIDSIRRGEATSVDDGVMRRLYLAGITSDFLRHPKIKNRIIEAAVSNAAAALERYRRGRVNELSDDRYGVNDVLFTQLSLLLDRGEDSVERWTRQKDRYGSLGEILKVNSQYPALVLLGDPGAGKSTLLRRLDLDIAHTGGDTSVAEKFSYFVSLRDYPVRMDMLPPDPMTWLRNKWAAEWQTKLPGLPDLGDLLHRESYLLLDALNEMPPSTIGYGQLVDRWAAFIALVQTEFPKCRMVFSCRSLDYSASLSSSKIQVPHVEIERLNKETIRQFLQHYAPEKWNLLFRAIEETAQIELYGTAYFLRILCDHAGRTGEIPQDRSALFTAFIRELLHRETEKQNPRLVSSGLLDESDLARLANRTWSSPYELPDSGLLVKQLANLAYSMQMKSAAAETSQVTITYSEVIAMLAPVVSPGQLEQFVDAACDLWILQHDRERGRVQFVHQLMQEYFAARRLAVAPDPDRVRIPWLQAETRPSLDETLADLNINEPLPPLRSTGWEETTLLAAPMAADRRAFLGALIDSNLPLAGRAAAQMRASVQHHDPKAVGISKLPDEIVIEIQSDLLKRMRNPEADLRVRIMAGKSLGELGHPSFVGKKNAGGRDEYLLPPVIRIPGRAHQIGTDERTHPHERPEHSVELAEFHLAQFQVTNGEWGCFMRAGGYDDERWWKTEAARQWRRGETTRAARDAQWRAWRDMLKRNPSYIEGKLATGELSQQAATEHYKARDLSDEEFEATLQRDFEESVRRNEAYTRYTEPRRWRNKDFNNPAQPVVGICWYEAQAYCAWLSDLTGQHWRLPTEAEWEAAARLGSAGYAPYPWGDKFDRANCNTFESHIRAPTPVGIFPGGDTAAGLVDMSGNTYEWTSSKYDKVKYPYPYKLDDGRENPEDVGDPAKYEPRVLRGGSWYYSKDEARIAFRLRFHPGYHNQSTGFRLALDGA